MKKLTPSKAVLPANERIIGGDAPRGMGNQDRKKEMKKIYDQIENKLKKKNARKTN